MRAAAGLAAAQVWCTAAQVPAAQWKSPADGYYGHAGWNYWPPAAAPVLDTDDQIWSFVTHSNKWWLLSIWATCMALFGLAVGYGGRRVKLSMFQTVRSPDQDARMTEQAPGDEYVERRKKPTIKLPPIVPLEWKPPECAGGGPAPVQAADRGFAPDPGERYEYSQPDGYHDHGYAPDVQTRGVEPQYLGPEIGECRQRVVDGWHAQEQWDGSRWVPVHYWDPGVQQWFEWYDSYDYDYDYDAQ
eukprot:TRINITY_DN45035_c0_g1_i1.p1 TRINITY_DN45035_c0_g1~~TRINITY_DN45035_c0_g1_i1.p1  ORF type:complete len:261 (+),score=87.77 TRINITY_DN45035_c0_g1_i1:53-784(+)